MERPTETETQQRGEAEGRPDGDGLERALDVRRTLLAALGAIQHYVPEGPIRADLVAMLGKLVDQIDHGISEEQAEGERWKSIEEIEREAERRMARADELLDVANRNGQEVQSQLAEAGRLLAQGERLKELPETLVGIATTIAKEEARLIVDLVRQELRRR